MIVVVGSRHDEAANALVASWPDSALCSAEDLSAPGWVWSHDGPRTWVVGGARVADSDVSGVFVRRSTVYPAELLGVHREDRGYLAAETHAFLVYVLATTHALVANPVGDGAIGDEALRPERWMPLATQCGLTLAPLRLSSRPRQRRRFTPRVVEVVADEAFGRASERIRTGCIRLTAALGLMWVVCVFNGRGGLVALTTRAVPDGDASAALARRLGTAA